MPPYPLANARLRHVKQVALRHATRLVPKQVRPPLGKFCIRPWTTTKKFISRDALVEFTLAGSSLCVVRLCITKLFRGQKLLKS